VTFRVTNKDLDLAVERLNAVSKRKYHIVRSYGKNRLVVAEKGTSINNIGYMDSKPELYYTLHTLLNYISKEKQEIT